APARTAEGEDGDAHSLIPSPEDLNKKFCTPHTNALPARVFRPRPASRARAEREGEGSAFSACRSRRCAMLWPFISAPLPSCPSGRARHPFAVELVTAGARPFSSHVSTQSATSFGLFIAVAS